MVFSSFNPVPYHRKIAGDFYYIYLRTLEGVDYHITANPRGFYLNCSQINNFNASPSSKRVFVCLLDLLRYVSPKFVETFDRYITDFKVNELDKMILTSVKSKSKCHWLNEVK